MTFLTFYAPYYVLPLTHKTMREGMEIESDQGKKIIHSHHFKALYGLDHLIMLKLSIYNKIMKLTMCPINYGSTELALRKNFFTRLYDLKGKSIFSNKNLYIKM